MSKDLVVVGIGSSAGGLEALLILLSNLSDIDNCSYIIAQHLSPTHKSMMVELLGRVTNLPVIEITNGLKIKSKTIYMTPENTDIYLANGKIYLKNIESTFGPKPSVNYFFSSLATEFKQKAIGIILSGTGSDGAYGIRAIKAEGGITIAQSPDSSKYDGMPLSAINTGKVDLVVSIENLASEIEQIIKNLDLDIESSINERLLQQIYKILFEEYGVDFSQYKKTTIIRRIERRMAALKIQDLKEYLDNLLISKDEVSNLYHDILIGVTAFFRDQEAFDILRKYIETITSKKEQGEEIRFWSIGCSTGEEAYSIAILLFEILGEKISKYKIKIFATDIDDESLKIARTGIYSETSLDGVDKKLIQKYFSIQKNQYEIRKSLRELVIFSRHNIVSDSPFLRLDLISCRNMLIYFNQNLQNKFFPVVHYALKDNGFLFLGKSETIGNFVDLFTMVDKNVKIYKAQFTGVKEPPKLFNYSTTIKNYEESKAKKYKDDGELLEEKIVEGLGNAILNQCVVINSSNDLIYTKGKIPFISHPQGRVTNNIFKLVSDELSLDLRSAINDANKSKEPKYTDYRSINIFDDVTKFVRILVVPIQDDKNDDWLNILFFQSEDSKNVKSNILFGADENEIIQKLQSELDNTKTHLQNVIEELETSYEEMQSLNEELQSSNEELQSSNEELETTNEELQSTNEELQTAYSELRVLYDDKDKRATQLETLMEKLNDKTKDLRNQKDLTEAIIDTAPIAITMVDKEGQLTFANNFALNLFGLTKENLLERTFKSENWKIRTYHGDLINDDELPFEMIRKTYEPVNDIKHTITIEDKTLYLSISGSPIFDSQGIFQGAVFCIEDVTTEQIQNQNISLYQKSLEDKFLVSPTNSEKILELIIYDVAASFKNNINELVLMASQDKTPKEALLHEIIKISDSLNDSLNFYTKNIYFDRRDLIEELEKNFILYTPVFLENKIRVINKLQTDMKRTFNTTTIKELFYNIINTVIFIKENYYKKSFTIVVSNEKLDDGIEIFIKFEEFDNSFSNDINNYLIQVNEDYKHFHCIFENGILKIVLG